MLTSQLITLRPFDRRHVAKTLAWANDPELTQLMDRAWPISDAEHEQWFSHLSERKDRLVYFAVETNVDGQHVGNVWLWNINWVHRKAECSIVIGERSVAGAGIGSEAIRLVTQYGFERLNLHKVYAHVLAINPRARRAFEKVGYEIEGTLKADRWVGDHYADVHLLARWA